MEEKFKDIVERVLQLYLKYGIKSITMDDVARELTISKKTLYQFVTDKTDLVDKAVTHQLDIHRCEMRNLEMQNLNAIDILIMASQFVAEQFQHINPSISYDLQKYYPQSWNKIVDYRRTHIYQHVRTNMIQGIEQGLYLDDLNVDIISHSYVLKMEEVFLRPDDDFFKKYTTDEIFKTLFHYHIRGIANKKGIEYYENKIKNEQ
ncbi:MAG: TetR/AcrR family transcriptional regulator [Bacteroidota bacterium]